MSKVLMISSNTFSYPYPVYPLGMAVVSGGLSGRGHSVCQFDYSVHENPDDKLKQVIKEFSPEFIGLSIRNIDEVDSLAGDLKVLNIERHIIKVIKGETGVPVISGGSAFSIMPEEILSHIKSDYGIVGSGEQQFADLIEILEKGDSSPQIIKGCLIEGQNGQSGSPLWGKELVDFYMGKSGMLNLQTKRGCPYNCSYCVYPALEGKRFKYRDHDEIIDDLERAKRVYNVDSFFFTDSVFNDPDGFYIELTEKIISSGLKIRWAGYFRPKGVGEREFKILKQSGLYAVEIGSDAGCDETLRCMGKGFTFSDVFDFYNGCTKEGIASAYFFIFGGPGETDATVKEGLANIRRLEEGVIFIYSGIRVLPGTSLYKVAIQEGVLSADDKLLEPVYYFSPEVNIDEMNMLIEQEAKNNRRLIFPPEKGKLMIDAMHAFGYRGLLWDELLKVTRKSERHRKRR
ncbi:MAG: radical SAM protein [Desulfatiglans sp.]|nr:radical SAM protein [Desulfatiglans sp.]